jgi:hypothetical protein
MSPMVAVCCHLLIGLSVMSAPASPGAPRVGHAVPASTGAPRVGRPTPGAMARAAASALPRDSVLQLSRRLGAVAIRMAAGGQQQLMVSDQGVQMAPPAASAPAATDLAEFRQLLADGADPMAVRIAGFQPAGPRSLGGSVTMMSSGNAGWVVLAPEPGLTLPLYLKKANLPQAVEVLALYGPFPREESEVFGDSLRSASRALRRGNPTRMLALMPDSLVPTMRQEFEAYAQLRERLSRLQQVAKARGVSVHQGLDPSGARDIFEGIDESSAIESDGTTVSVSTPGGDLRFERAGKKWQPSVDLSGLPKVLAFTRAKGQLADSLAAGIRSGAVTNDNVREKTLELVNRFLSPLNK